MAPSASRRARATSSRRRMPQPASITRCAWCIAISNALRTIEVPVEMRERMAGETSLTVPRSIAALLRLLILLAVVPLRGPAAGDRR